ncbi:MAG: FHA domain-containing protein [Planctomycetota bacterium]
MTVQTQTIAELVLASGSHAGVAAHIRSGFYMIGRHQECQIRPKSRSVSRRHCLIHFHEGSLRVFDLDSTSGTRVRGQRIASRTWVELHNDQELRCGKVAFSVKLRDTDSRHATDAQSGVVENSDDSVDLLRGDAWQADDVAAFLDEADEQDRLDRYASIRSKANEDGGQGDGRDEFDDEYDLTSNATTTNFDSQLADGDTQATLGDGERSGSNGDHAEPAPEHTSRAKSPKSGNVPATKSLPARKKTPSQPRDWNAAKIMIASLVAVAVLAFFIFRIYQFQAGQPTPIVPGID